MCGRLGGRDSGRARDHSNHIRKTFWQPEINPGSNIGGDLA